MNTKEIASDIAEQYFHNVIPQIIKSFDDPKESAQICIELAALIAANTIINFFQEEHLETGISAMMSIIRNTIESNQIKSLVCVNEKEK